MTQAQVWELAAHLTDRDREIVVTLFEQRVLRTDQVAVLFFSSVRRAQDRMLFLYRHRVVDRFYPAAPRGHGKAAGALAAGRRGRAHRRRVLRRGPQSAPLGASQQLG